MSIELIIAEFGSVRKNAGDARFRNGDRLNPTLETMMKFFPDLSLTIYTDQEEWVSLPKKISNIGKIVIRFVPQIGKLHQRQPWRSSSFYKIIGLLDAEEEIAIAMDADFHVLNEQVLKLFVLTKKFGCCVAMNPRYLVKVDTAIGNDSDRKLDESGGMGLAINGGVMSFNTKSEKARRFLRLYAKKRLETGRGTVAFWRAQWESGEVYQPYILPPQWNVCKEHIGIRNEIILHMGHKDVKKYYKI